MPRHTKNKPSNNDSVSRPPAWTPENREMQLVNLAVNLAEQQLRDGTASAQVITHYLKLGSTKERLEKEILEEQKRFLGAKTRRLDSETSNEQLYAKALAAFKIYSGDSSGDDDTNDECNDE